MKQLDGMKTNDLQFSNCKKMEIKEISQHMVHQRPLTSFSAITAEEKIIIKGAENYATILEPVYYPDSMEGYTYNISEISAPTFQPANKIIADSNTKSIYENLKIPEKHTLALDPLYTQLFSEINSVPQVVDISAAPENVFSEPIMAIVSSFGACELRTKRNFEREWNETRYCINDTWESIFNPNWQQCYNNFSILKSYVEDFCIAKSCWVKLTNSSECMLLCGTLSGWIVVFKIEDGAPKFLYKFSSGTYKITCMKSFEISTSKITKTFLAISDLTGVIKLFEIKQDNIEEVSVLWSKKDNMASVKIDVDYCKKTSKILLVTSKASHFLVFILNTNGIVIEKTSYYAGNISITGFEKLDPFEFILSTITGCVEHIKISFNKSQLEINSTQVKHELDHNRMHIQGMVTSKNKAAWLFLLYPSIIIDSKQVSIISTGILNTIDLITIMKNDETNDISKYPDCAEMVRLLVIKNYFNDELLNYNPFPVQTSNSFLHRLRIRLIISTSFLFNATRKRSHSNSYKNEVASIIAVIKAIGIYKRLNYLLTIKQLTKFQKLSGMCMRKALISYLKEEFSVNFSQIKQILTPVIETLLENSENTFKGEEIVETCAYCEKEISTTELYCTDNHKLQRCCISYLQVPPIVINRHCINCKEIVIDDDMLLKTILPKKDEIRCPLCNSMLVFATDMLSFKYM